MSTGHCLVFRNKLFAEVLSLVVGLVLVVFLQICGHAASLWQTPSGEVSLGRRQGSGLGNVSTGSNLHRSGNLEFQAIVGTSAASESKGVLCVSFKLRLVFRLVLSRTRVLF